MLKKAFVFALIIFSYASGFGQTTLLPAGSEDMYLLDRLETRSGILCDSLATGDRPESRRNAVHFLESIKARTGAGPGVGQLKAETDSNKKFRTGLSRIDEYNLKQMISENWLWAVTGLQCRGHSCKPQY